MDKGLKQDGSYQAYHVTHIWQLCWAFPHLCEFWEGWCYRVQGGRGQLCSTAVYLLRMVWCSKSVQIKHNTEQTQCFVQKEYFEPSGKACPLSLYMAIQQHSFQNRGITREASPEKNMKAQNTPLNRKEELFLNCWITGKAHSIEDSQQIGSLEMLCTKKKRLSAEV